VIANRLLMIVVSLLCLMVLYLRFSTIERDKKNAEHNQTSIEVGNLARTILN
jgi:hypothetical protein